MFLVLLMLSSLNSTVFARMNFTGHRLYSLSANNTKKLSYLKKLFEEDEIDVWNDQLKVNQRIDVHIPPHLVNQLEHEWRSESIQFDVISSNLQKLIDHEREENDPDDAGVTVRSSRISVDHYHRWEVIYNFLEDISNSLRLLVQLITIGETFEGNLIQGVKVGMPGHGKPAIWIEAGVHGREWVGTATAVYIIRELITWYTMDSRKTNLVDAFDFYIFPVINVDGYKYTWTQNRFWGKNRVEHPSERGRNYCKGVDLNRNFEVKDTGEDQNGKICSSRYPGKHSFSEAETQATRNAILFLGDSVKAYFSLHGFSQLWMIPFASKNGTSDHEDQMRALYAAVNATHNKHGVKYKFGTTDMADPLYQSFGTSVDWAYEKAGIKYSFLIQLRDKGKQGLLLDNSLIVPTAEENFAGIKAIAKIIWDEFGLSGLII